MKLIIFFIFFITLIFPEIGFSKGSKKKLNPSLSKKAAPKIEKTRRPRPNAQVLYSNVFLKKEPSEKSENILILNEGDKIRISPPINNNFLKTLIYMRKKRYEGWLHVENILLPKEFSKTLLKKIQAYSNEEKDSSISSEKEKEKTPPVNRPLETTLIISPSSSFTVLGLDFYQGSYGKTGTSKKIDASTSQLSLSLNTVLGISPKLNLLIGVGYLITGKERFVTKASTSTYEAEGFQDFSIGFKSSILKQNEKKVELVLEAGWISGFMPHSLPTYTQKGGAGKGSHDFYLGIITGKSFKSFSPHFNFKIIKYGSSTRHTADDESTQKYSSFLSYQTVFGVELPQFLPAFLINPRLGFNYKTSQNVQYIETEAHGFIGSTYCLNIGVDLFLYKGRKTFLFKYDWLWNTAYDLQEQSIWYSITNKNKHLFTVGIRF